MNNMINSANLDTFGKRLNFMLQTIHMDKTTFANLIGVHRTSVHWWINGTKEGKESNPRAKHNKVIEDIFSDFNPTWIFYGRGEMYKDGVMGKPSLVIQLEKTIEDKDKLIKLLEEKIRLYESREATK